MGGLFKLAIVGLCCYAMWHGFHNNMPDTKQAVVTLLALFILFKLLYRY